MEFLYSLGNEGGWALVSLSVLLLLLLAHISAHVLSQHLSQFPCMSADPVSTSCGCHPLVCLCLPACRPACLPACLSVCLSVCLKDASLVHQYLLSRYSCYRLCSRPVHLSPPQGSSILFYILFDFVLSCHHSVGKHHLSGHFCACKQIEVIATPYNVLQRGHGYPFQDLVIGRLLIQF